MIFNKNGIAFPDYQDRTAKLFTRTDHHDMKQWNACKNLIKSYRTCLEFGAHVGTSAILYSPEFKNVISFEPIPDLYECLEYNTKDINNVETYNLAISSESKMVTIYVNQNNSGSSVVESKDTEKLISTRWKNKKRKNFQKMPSYQVEGRSIDSFLFNEVDFIKIDTEGYNTEPLTGMVETLKRCSPVIQIERNGQGFGVKESNEILFSLGYKKKLTIDADDIYVKQL